MENYDVIFIGAGPGGYIGAIRAAQRGASVAVVERERVGGVCLNWGCIPTKSIIASVHALRVAREAESMGLKIDGAISADPAAVWKRKDKIVETLTRGIASLLKSNGVKLIEGAAKFISANEIEVSGANAATQLNAKKIVIATGSRPAALPGIEPDGKLILTSTDVLANPQVPANLLIVGAGAIGMEFAGIFSALGSKVTVIEMMPRPLPMEDEDVSTLIARELKKQKIKLIVSEKIAKLVKTDNGVKAELSGGGVIEADRVLVSIGRAFNTESLGLDIIGIAAGKRGEIIVNSKMETSVPGVYAIGDVTGGPLLAHVAGAGGIVAAENATGGDRSLDLDVVPACTFTYPEVSSVGLREWQAVERGIDVKVGRFAVRGLGMAQAIGEIAGEVKVVTDKNHRVLGVHIVSAGASMIIHEAALAIKKGLTIDEWVSMIHAHPSMSESLVEAAEDVAGMAIHLPKLKS